MKKRKWLFSVGWTRPRWPRCDCRKSDLSVCADYLICYPGQGDVLRLARHYSRFQISRGRPRNWFFSPSQNVILRTAQITFIYGQRAPRLPIAHFFQPATLDELGSRSAPLNSNQVRNNSKTIAKRRIIRLYPNWCPCWFGVQKSPGHCSLNTKRVFILTLNKPVSLDLTCSTPSVYSSRGLKKKRRFRLCSAVVFCFYSAPARSPVENIVAMWFHFKLRSRGSFDWRQVRRHFKLSLVTQNNGVGMDGWNDKLRKWDLIGAKLKVKESNEIFLRKLR